MRRPLLVVGLMALGACSENGLTTQLQPGSLQPRAALAPGNNTAVVTEDDVSRQVENAPPNNNWVLYTRAGTPPTAGAFEVGPGSPPLGVGSFRTITNLSTEKVFLFNYDHVGTSLSAIDGISYSTYRTAASIGVAYPSLNIQVDIDGGTLVAGSGDFRTFVWEPYNQPGFVNSPNTWVNQDAYSGGNGFWWSTTGGASGLATGGDRSCGQATPCTWNALLAAFPGAIVGGGFGINQGSGNPGVDGNTDALSIGYGGSRITYDFEPYAVATSADACKDGGWQNVKRADGSSFKNQGDCVSYVKNGK